MITYPLPTSQFIISRQRSSNAGRLGRQPIRGRCCSIATREGGDNPSLRDFAWARKVAFCSLEENKRDRKRLASGQKVTFIHSEQEEEKKGQPQSDRWGIFRDAREPAENTKFSTRLTALCSKKNVQHVTIMTMPLHVD
jgi:hypothetical protein